jgi:Putative prokaryotic signal transducing protein
MALINHDREQQRLAALYASMNESELAQLANDQRSLTEDALHMLESEFSRRGLHFERQNLAAVDDREDVKLVALCRFRDLPEALVAKGLLDSAGIKCFLSDENTVRMDWMWSNALGGVRLWVREDDLSESAGLLGYDFSNEPEITDSTDRSGSI